MEALGIQLRDEPEVFDIILALLGAFIAPLGAIFSLLDDVEELARLLETNPFAQIGPAGVPLQVAWTEFGDRARDLRLQGITARDKFREGIEEAAKETPPPGLTFTI